MLSSTLLLRTLPSLIALTMYSGSVALGQVNVGPGGVQFGPRGNAGALPAPLYNGSSNDRIQQGLSQGAQGLMEGRSLNQSIQRGVQAGITNGAYPNNGYYNNGYYNNSYYNNGYPSNRSDYRVDPYRRDDYRYDNRNYDNRYYNSGVQAGVQVGPNGVAVQTYVPGQTYRTSNGAYWRADAQGRLMQIPSADTVVRQSLPAAGVQSSIVAQPLPANRPGLGVNLEAFGQSGVRISDVVAGSPAEQAGLKRGDVILSLNGQPMTNVTAVVQGVGRWQENQPLPLVVQRDGQSMEVTASLENRQQVFAQVDANAKSNMSTDRANDEPSSYSAARPVTPTP